MTASTDDLEVGQDAQLRAWERLLEHARGLAELHSRLQSFATNQRQSQVATPLLKQDVAWRRHAHRSIEEAVFGHPVGHSLNEAVLRIQPAVDANKVAGLTGTEAVHMLRTMDHLIRPVEHQIKASGTAAGVTPIAAIAVNNRLTRLHDDIQSLQQLLTGAVEDGTYGESDAGRLLAALGVTADAARLLEEHVSTDMTPRQAVDVWDTATSVHATLGDARSSLRRDPAARAEAARRLEMTATGILNMLPATPQAELLRQTVLRRELQDLTRQAQNTGSEIQDIREHAADAASAVGTAKQSQEFADWASQEAHTASVWRGSAVATAFAGVALNLALLAGVGPLPASDSLEEALHQLGVTVLAGGLAAYMAREAGQHRAVARWARSLAVQLTTVFAYTDGLPSAARDEVRSALALRTFAGQGPPLAVDPSNGSGGDFDFRTAALELVKAQMQATRAVPSAPQAPPADPR